MSKEVDDQIKELRKIAQDSGVDVKDLLEKAKKQLLKDNQSEQKLDDNTDPKHQDSTVNELESIWNKVLLARHSERPSTLQYIDKISDQYMELRGDRVFKDDSALVGGICTIGKVHFTFIGHQKGANMKENIYRNYGMAHPEGYRKALRLVKQAEKFQRPIISFIDTSGAYAGSSSEERGIGQAIAVNLMEFSSLEVPIICIIIGEGGSGGALGIGVGDKIFMLENAVYSVISPEGCASILLRDPKRMKEAAAFMKVTAQDVLRFGFIDGIIPEPPKGAHTDADAMAQAIRDAILHAYAELRTKDINTLMVQRSKKIINWTRSEQNNSYKSKKFFQKVKDFFIE